jgi:DNA/RNA-binding domain of Phe-tRNA-synthetase-like protein
MKKIIIKDEIFDLFPDFYRGIVIVKDMTNQKSNKRIKRLLKKEIDSHVEINESEDSRILAWEEAYRRMGLDSKSYMPSIKYLIHAIKPNRSLAFINSAVALFNYISIKYVTPCGGDDIIRIEGNLVLGIAKGTETFIPLGGGTKENPDLGEVIYYDGLSENVMCRRFNWRNGDITKIEVESKKAVLNIDSLPPVSPDICNKACYELAELIRLYCEADVETMHLDYHTREAYIP